MAGYPSPARAFRGNLKKIRPGNSSDCKAKTQFSLYSRYSRTCVLEYRRNISAPQGHPKSSEVPGALVRGCTSGILTFAIHLGMVAPDARPYPGEVAERPKAAVLKTVDSQGSGGSNPPLSASSINKIICNYMVA